MVFSSFPFLLGFLPLMLLGFYCLRAFKQDFLAKVSLVLGSLFFYSFWNPSYLPLLLGSIGVNFVIGKRILNSFSRTPSVVLSALPIERGGGAKKTPL